MQHTVLRSTAAAAAAVIALGWGGPAAMSAGPGAGQGATDVATTAYRMRMAGRIHEAAAFLREQLPADAGGPRAQFELARIEFLAAMARSRKGWSGKGRPPIPDFGPAARAIERAIAADSGKAQYPYWAGVIGVYTAIAEAHGEHAEERVPEALRGSADAFERAVQLEPGMTKPRGQYGGTWRTSLRRWRRCAPVPGAGCLASSSRKA